MKLISKIIKNVSFLNYLFYTLYVFCCWISYILIISIIAFFHFQLSHKLSGVEEWVIDNKWEVIAVTKLVAFYVIFAIIRIKSEEKNILRKVIRENIKLPRLELYVLIVVFVSYFLFLGRPEFNNVSSGINIFQMLKVYLGNFIFYFVDSMVVYLLVINSPIKKFAFRILYLVFISAIFTFLNIYVFKIEKNSNLMLITMNFYVCNIFTCGELKNLNHGIYYLLFFASPIAVPYGIAPFMEGQNSIYIMTKQLTAVHAIVLVFVASVYVIVKEKKRIST